VENRVKGIVDVTESSLGFIEEKAKHLLVLSMAVYTLIFSYFTTLKYYTFNTYASDLGIFEQSLWSTLEYGLFLYNTPELGIHFKTHFDPILILFLPAYSIYPSPLTLLVLQSFLISLGAIPIFYLAKDELRSRKAGLLFVVLYFLYPPLQGVNWYDFHPECLLPFFLVSAFYLFKKRKYTSYFLLIILGLMCKETVSLIVFFMGLYGLWINRKKILTYSVFAPKELVRDKGIAYSILTLVVSALWYIMASKIIGMYSLVGQTYYFQWGYLGVGLFNVITNIIFNPLYALQLAFTPFSAKTFYLLVLLAPLAFLSILNPPSLLIATPWLTASMLSLLPNYYQPVGTQYPALIIPFIFISAIYGAKATEPIIQTITRKAFTGRFAGRILRERRIRRLTIGVSKKPLTVTFMILLILGVSCGIAWTALRLNNGMTPHDEILNTVVNLIPPYSLVATQNDIFPHLSHDLNAYPVYYPGVEYEYILVDQTTVWYYVTPYNYGESPTPPVSFSSVVPNLLESKQYGLVVGIDGILLLLKGYNGPPLINVSLPILSFS
jgi:uncharacterized membrane protein